MMRSPRNQSGQGKRSQTERTDRIFGNTRVLPLWVEFSLNYVTVYTFCTSRF
jgi:hypothetical protein